MSAWLSKYSEGVAVRQVGRQTPRRLATSHRPAAALVTCRLRPHSRVASASLRPHHTTPPPGQERGGNYEEEEEEEEEEET
ncbi:hypothetical protein E2C01_093518 [Portunus trituberculatus]|uniref:Uncharacterized protein n=1 Tax=Portunus trituberculatus TaxID=210409 RepID=A0A5B7JUE7_PORTR|nr:hypothetical protein [Portunus trituberculatus]